MPKMNSGLPQEFRSRRLYCPFLDSEGQSEIVDQTNAGSTTWGTGLTIDSAEKVFFRKSEKNISHTDALYRTIGAWLIIFFIPNFRE